MTLTITERQHWKDRVAKRIDKAIEYVYIGKDPGLLQRIKKKARQRAIEQLGISKLLNRCDEIAKEKKAT